MSHDARQRATTRYRYELSDGDYTDHHPTRADAFSSAARWAERKNLVVIVYDRMARRGQPQLWEVHPGKAPELKGRNDREALRELLTRTAQSLRTARETK